MAALPLALLQLLLLGAAGSEVREGTGAMRGVVICSCDLSLGNCDLNCCCDPDCALIDPASVFSFCLPGSTKVQRRVCLYNWLIFRSNTPLSTERVPSTSPRTPELFCVIPSDSSLNYFVTPQSVNGTSFSVLGDRYRGASFSPSSQSIPTFPGFYTAGDPILTISPSNTLGELRQPAPVGAQRICSDSNPAKFLQSDTTSCLRIIRNLSESCMTDPSLSAPYYYQNISVLKVPADVTIIPSSKVQITSLVTNSATLQGDQCVNVVSEVTYTVRYNGTQGITSVTVSFTLLNVSGSSLSLQQSFSVLYRSSSAALSSVQTRSGNPGYLVGYPVLSDTGPLSALSSLGDGSCSRSPVQFGVNTLSGCTIRGLTSESCADLRIRADRELLGASSPQRLAVFGNATFQQENNWAQIVYQNCSGQSPGDCSSSCLLPVSLHIQILQAEVGLLSNPQSQVLGSRFLYSCRPVQCQDATVLQTQVSFTDISRRGPAPRSAPTITGKAPRGFFYPFEVSASAGETAAPLLSLLVLLLGHVLCI
ncbi:hypothetical protein FKM82_002664 [Ascaphus truei]